MSRKKRSDSVLNSLTELQQAELVDWLISGTSYAEAAKRLRQDFKVEVSSTSAFTSFYREAVWPEILRRRTQAAQASKDLVKETNREHGQWDAATEDALSQKLYELSINPGAGAEAIAFVGGLLQQRRELTFKQDKAEQDRISREKDQALREKALALKREEFEFDAAKKVLEHLPKIKEVAEDTTLNQHELITAVRRELWGVLPEEQPTA